MSIRNEGHRSTEIRSDHSVLAVTINSGFEPLLPKNMNPDMVMEVCKMQETEIASADPVELVKGTSSGGVYFNPQERDMLRKLGSLGDDTLLSLPKA